MILEKLCRHKLINYVDFIKLRDTDANQHCGQVFFYSKPLENKVYLHYVVFSTDSNIIIEFSRKWIVTNSIEFRTIAYIDSNYPTDPIHVDTTQSELDTNIIGMADLLDSNDRRYFCLFPHRRLAKPVSQLRPPKSPHRVNTPQKTEVDVVASRWSHFIFLSLPHILAVLTWFHSK